MKIKNKLLIILTIFIISFTLVSGVSAGQTGPLSTDANGTVSGAVDVITSSPNMPGYNEIEYNLPENVNVSNIEYAEVYTNVYIGSGSNTNYRANSVVQFDGGDGYQVIGNESLYTNTASTEGTVYPVPNNNHTFRVYSDFQSMYDVKDLINGHNLKVSINTTRWGEYDFDGRVKLISFVIAYNDGDNDKIQYWVNSGQDWIDSGSKSSGVSTNVFDTSQYAGNGTIKLTNVALSSNDGNYKIGDNQLIGGKYEFGSYYQRHDWTITNYFIDNETIIKSNATGAQPLRG